MLPTERRNNTFDAYAVIICVPLGTPKRQDRSFPLVERPCCRCSKPCLTDQVVASERGASSYEPYIYLHSMSQEIPWIS